MNPRKGPYAQTVMGNGQPVPLTPQGAPDINAIVGGMLDRGKWYYYDTLKLAPGATVVGQYSFFSVPLGAPDPNNNNAAKTLLETNLPTANRFDIPYDLILDNLGFYFVQDSRLYDITQIMKFGYIEFKILEKVYFQGHLWRHPPGAGVYGVSTQTSESSWTNGIPQPSAIYAFRNWAKYIAPQMRFSLTLQFLETVGLATNNTLSSIQTAAGQSTSALPTLLTANQGGNGIWLIAVMNGLADRAVQ